VLGYVSAAFLLLVNIGSQVAIIVQISRPGVINKRRVDIFQTSLNVMLLEVVVWDFFFQPLILAFAGLWSERVRRRLKALTI
jgi:hypothetical protein